MTDGLDSDEISLLDLLVTMAESWRLLVFGPLAAGLIGFGVAFVWPTTYHSDSNLSLPSTGFNAAVAQVIATSDEFLITVGAKAGFLESGADGVDGKLLEKLRKMVAVNLDRRSMFLHLRVAGKTPDQAKTFGQIVVDELLHRSVPVGSARQKIEVAINSARQKIEGYKVAEAAITSLLGQLTTKDTTSAGLISSLIAVQGDIETSRNRILALELELMGVGKNAVLDEPNLPRITSSPKRGLIAVFSALASGFALLLWVFMRQAWRNAANKPETVDKIKALRAAYAGRSADRPS